MQKLMLVKGKKTSTHEVKKNAKVDVMQAFQALQKAKTAYKRKPNELSLKKLQNAQAAYEKADKAHKLALVAAKQVEKFCSRK